ncbi:hypothetical protein ACFCW4_35435 [Streptomyces virginiae]|uniref:hypothetical protein n=1 Tax=Streptomyces virginiae TaxID=1961 RepID=UPI0035DC6B29
MAACPGAVHVRDFKVPDGPGRRCRRRPGPSFWGTRCDLSRWRRRERPAQHRPAARRHQRALGRRGGPSLAGPRPGRPSPGPCSRCP